MTPRRKEGSPGREPDRQREMAPDQIAALCEAGWVDAAESILGRHAVSGRDEESVGRARELAGVARRVLALDAEDLEVLAPLVDPALGERLVAAGFPHRPDAEHRGALGDLVGLYELMLEVLDTRMVREEPQHIVVTAHIIGEYLTQLAWQPVLGHGGDPAALPHTVGQRWGGDGQGCAHTSAMNATARRALHAARGDEVGYTAYLNKFHSRLGEALGVCAMNHEIVAAGQRPDVGITCPHPCAWVLAWPRQVRSALDARVRLARIYQESPLVALRHHAPVGHFFGVPSAAEISQAWIATWTKLTEQWPDGCNPLCDRDAPGWRVEAPQEALPGLSRLVSVVAARPIRAGHLLGDLREAVVAEVLGDDGSGRGVVAGGVVSGGRE